MKLHLFEYTCQACDIGFKAPELMPGSYGEFLMRSASGDTVFLNALEDPVYREVDDLLAYLLNGQSVSAVKRASLLRTVFGIACDSDAQGYRYGINTSPLCPHCGSLDMEGWKGTELPEFVDIDLPLVSHFEWTQLSPTEKALCVKQALGALGYVC